jgi:hypothetical protein
MINSVGQMVYNGTTLWNRVFVGMVGRRLSGASTRTLQTLWSFRQCRAIRRSDK